MEDGTYPGCAPDANHGRWHLPIIPITMPDMPYNWFVNAKKGINNDIAELRGLSQK